MAILTNTQTTVYRSPKPCFYVEYDPASKRILSQGNGQISTQKTLICADTQEEIAAQITSLSLTVPQSNRQKAAAYFATLASDVQASFLAAFQAISAIPKDADAITALQAVVVDANLETVKANFVSLLKNGTMATS